MDLAFIVIVIIRRLCDKRQVFLVFVVHVSFGHILICFNYFHFSLFSASTIFIWNVLRHTNLRNEKKINTHKHKKILIKIFPANWFQMPFSKIVFDFLKVNSLIWMRRINKWNVIQLKNSPEFLFYFFFAFQCIYFVRIPLKFHFVNSMGGKRYWAQQQFRIWIENKNVSSWGRIFTLLSLTHFMYDALFSFGEWENGWQMYEKRFTCIKT